MPGRKPTGFVTHRRGHWRVFVTVDGRRRLLPEKFDTRQDAEDFRDEVRIARNRDEWQVPTDDTVAGFAPVFLRAKSVKVKPNTLAEYRGTVEAHIVPRLGSRRLSAVTPEDMLDFYTQLIDVMSVKSAHNVFSVARQLFHVAMRMGRIRFNPAVGVELGKKPKPKIEVWTPEQTRRFIERTPEPVSSFAAVAAATGMRRSEVLGLTWDAIDFEKRTVSVLATVVMVDNQPTFRPMEAKTDRSLRTLSVHDATVARLKALRASQAAQRLAMGEMWQDTLGLVFTDEAGRVLSPDRITRMFQSEAKRLGLPAIGPKGLRSSYATTALRIGTHPKIVQERLGHSTIATTLDRYSVVTEEMDREAADEIAEAILGG